MITPILIKGGAALTATAAMLAGAPLLDNAFGSSGPAAMPVSWEQQRSVDSGSATSSHVAVLKAEEERKKAERKAKREAKREAERKARKAAERKAKKEAERKAAQERAARSRAAQGGTPAQNRALGMQMCAERGWSSYQCEDLGRLWQKESGWSSSAHNSSSGAHGIPQSLPGSKMSSHGSDWATSARTQIAWGLDYIAGRYGNPSNAWAHSQSRGWY